MPRIDCECGNALILDQYEQTTCPRCGCQLTAPEASANHSKDNEQSLADLTPTILGEIDEAALSHAQPPPAIPVERPPTRLDYSTDGRPTPPAGSSLKDPFGRTGGENRSRFRDWIMPLISPRAMIFSVFMFMPLSCFGLTASALGMFVTWGEFSFTDLSAASIVGFFFCMPNVLLFFVFPSLYLPLTATSAFVFYTIQLFYFYSIGLFVRRILRH